MSQSIPKAILKWCEENGWTDPQLAHSEWYAIPPGGSIPCQLPAEAIPAQTSFVEVLPSVSVKREGNWMGETIDPIAELQRAQRLIDQAGIHPPQPDHL